LHPSLRKLFQDCFESGHNNPQLRPNAQTWQSALNEAENALVTCAANNHHRYGNHLKTCPWCERTLALGGRDPFPSSHAVQTRQHLQPIKKPKRTTPLVRTDTKTASARRTLSTQLPLLGRTPTKKKRFSPFVIGLLGVATLGFLEILVIVRDLNFTSDNGATSFPTTSDVASPSSITNSPKGASAYYNQGDAYSKLGDYEGAIDKYTKAIGVNPNDAKAYVNRGKAHYEIAQHSGDPDKDFRAAIDDFNRALIFNPQAAEAYLKRGIVRYEIAQYSKEPDKDYKSAIDDFNKALVFNPQSAEAYVKRGIVRSKLAQYSGDSNKGYKASIDDFNKALSLNPQSAEAYVKRGIVRYEIAQYSNDTSKDYWGAVEDLQKAAKLFLEQGDIDHYQQALGNICVALEKNCDSFLRNPEKFVLSGSPPVKGNAK